MPKSHQIDRSRVSRAARSVWPETPCSPVSGPRIGWNRRLVSSISPHFTRPFTDQ